jgi:NADPH:quinone reductase-like Zn-dependent oxidoreductase
VKAVQYDRFGGEDVLEVRDVDDPVASAGRAVVAVKAASINPGEVFVRVGRAAETFPSTFPSGQGSDLAGEVVAVGEDVTEFAPGDAVLGWSDERSSQAELVAVPVTQLIAKPPELSWEVAGSLFIAGAAAVACVRAVTPSNGEVVVVSAATGGVGSIAVQLVAQTGATVIGIASEPNHEWLRSVGVMPVTYGDGVADRIRAIAPHGVDAFVDAFGAGYVDVALQLGVPRARINTIVDRAAAQQHGVKASGTYDLASRATLEELAALVVAGDLEVPIAHVYPLEDVQDAYRELARRHTHGKIVLRP